MRKGMKTKSSFIENFEVSEENSIDHTQKRFNHRLLDLTGNNFRLLRVLPQHNDSQLIELDIQHFIHGEQPCQALLYMWGNYDECHTVLINDRPFGVRQNLWSFFDHLQRLSTKTPEDATWYWIDAICIDQSYVRERNHQVQLMAQIYSTASEVLVWLGEAENESDAASGSVPDRPNTCVCFRLDHSNRCEYHQGIYSCLVPAARYRLISCKIVIDMRGQCVCYVSGNTGSGYGSFRS